MAGLVPAIHVFLSERSSLPTTIVVGMKGVDARHKAEHDDQEMMSPVSVTAPKSPSPHRGEGLG
jgi:hypothetical protein